MVTLDNALNNGTLMRSLERRLKAEGVSFSEHGNRIRCFPHVINIAVKTALSRIGDVELDDADNVTLDEIFEYLPPNESIGMSKAYRESLSKDLVGCAHKLVNASRSSGKRRDALRDAILAIRRAQTSHEGNHHYLMREVVLLRDVDTRWSSTFLMIDRLLELYPAIKEIANSPENNELQSLLLEPFDLGVLSDIRFFLKTFHLVQELASAQKTPCLAIVLPLYEQLITNLRLLKNALPNLSHAIESALQKIHEYQDKCHSTNMYSFAMCMSQLVIFKFSFSLTWAVVVNPTCKLKWVEEHWTQSRALQAKEAIKETVCYKKLSEMLI
ncbi:hypothetical protein EV360DRAFT_51958 [Lentinula raphanica]|nr:hypothetical protein EV360DRAFT_51958 [Lentinula raphanica]